MAVYLKEFSTHSEYEQYINSSDAILPNVSICTTEEDVHYSPYVEPPTVVAKFNITSTSEPTKIANSTSNFSEIEIDGSKQPSVITDYTFNTVGEHVVKYTLVDPTSIGDSAFSGCTSLTSIDIPDSVTSIGSRVFYYCQGLTSITIPDSVTSISEWAFFRCTNLTSITIPDSVTSIGDDAFYNCGFTSITIPDSVTSIGESVFYTCSSLTSCTIGSGVTEIGWGTFYWCDKLTNIVISDSVTSIGRSAFQYCRSLTSIDIPSGVTNIGQLAFEKCRSLTSVTVNATTPPTLGWSAFSNNASGRKIYVPSASVNDYKAATYWSDYANYILPIS